MSHSPSVYETVKLLGGEDCTIGVIYNTNTSSIKYIGNIERNLRHGYGLAFDDKSNIVFEGDWKDGVKQNGGIEYSQEMTFSGKEQDLTESFHFYNCYINSIYIENVVLEYIQNLSISKHSSSVDTLNFQELKNLITLQIGNHCFTHVKEVCFENLLLTRIEIGRNSFSYHHSSECRFIILSCPKLSFVSIGAECFLSYSIFSIRCMFVNFVVHEDAPVLADIRIGDCSFSKVDVVNLTCLSIVSY